MTSTAEPLLPEARPTRLDRWRIRLASDPVFARRAAWIAPLTVTLLAALLRLSNVGHPHAIVFDETYYVKDAWSQWILGYAATWPEGADERFLAGETDIFTDDGSFVVHPPLGKYLIGLPMAILGADSTFAWRLGTALAGTACVLVLYFLARALSGSIITASLASGLLAIDGLGIVMSRVALLDIFLTLFALVAFWFVVLDRRDHRTKLAERTFSRWTDDGPPAWGPVLWNRPWVIAAGAAAGAATAVKWSGVWVLAAIGLYLVVSDALARRRHGVVFWPADAAFRQGIASFLLLVPAGFVVYLASWTGWLVTDGGYDRHVADASPAAGIWSWVPLSLQSLWQYHERIYASTSAMATPHAYGSPAVQWPLLLRPTSMYAGSTADGTDGCAAANGCWQILYSMPNPLVWWASVLAVGYVGYRFVRFRDGRAAVVLTAVAATYLPWLLFPARTIFQFYTVLIQPFLLLALVFAIAAFVGRPEADPARRIRRERIVVVFLGVVVALAVFWYPLWSAIEVPYDFYRLHNWLPGWV
ncbi:dolichyl-phosphate-mannose--protein mannosyltransferase [Microbacterium radiodurans]|uniref:Polyprenol-phosphate-mannose--protein mannosyltransferase n=1 Tax=Microbacterium radiodurans TaxID=661398 RepID=A0A5J5IT40_9MICO|nr:phospholipid carrier-dependent glycosyltransferase [Microbacterium radiodurans]KAA9086564.1 phospholipid carrier-dependent glycosyltransferase [Microbacterium radiodurans]